MHPILFLPPAERYFKKIKEKGLKKSFHEAINQIGNDPYSGVEKKGDLAGIYGYDLYYRGVNYEIVYRIAIKEDGTSGGGDYGRDPRKFLRAIKELLILNPPFYSLGPMGDCSRLHRPSTLLAILAPSVMGLSVLDLRESLFK